MYDEFKNINLSEHNITNIEYIGVDGNDENYSIAGSESFWCSCSSILIWTFASLKYFIFTIILNVANLQLKFMDKFLTKATTYASRSQIICP